MPNWLIVLIGILVTLGILWLIGIRLHISG